MGQTASLGIESVLRPLTLHCTTHYPCADESTNLRAISTLREAFPERKVGFSDHTIGNVAPVAAVAVGASVIEKHCTLAKNLSGTDHVLPVTPPELVSSIRRLEVQMGSGEKAPVHEELKMRDFVQHRWAKRLRWRLLATRGVPDIL